MRATCGLHFESLRYNPRQPRGNCYSFSLNPPRYDRLMGIVRSVSREYATELSCYIVKRVGRVSGWCRRANPSTKIYSN